MLRLASRGSLESEPVVDPCNRKSNAFPSSVAGYQSKRVPVTGVGRYDWGRIAPPCVLREVQILEYRVSRGVLERELGLGGDVSGQLQVIPSRLCYMVVHSYGHHMVPPAGYVPEPHSVLVCGWIVGQAFTDWNRALTFRIVSPAGQGILHLIVRNRSIICGDVGGCGRANSRREIASGRYLLGIQIRRYGALSVGVVTPAYDRTVRLQGHGVVVPCGNPHYT